MLFHWPLLLCLPREFWHHLKFPRLYCPAGFISHSCDSALSLSLSEWELWIIFFGSTYTRDFHLDNLQKSQWPMLSKRHLSSSHIPLLQCSCNRSHCPVWGSSTSLLIYPTFHTPSQIIHQVLGYSVLKISPIHCSSPSLCFCSSEWEIYSVVANSLWPHGL